MAAAGQIQLTVVTGTPRTGIAQQRIQAAGAGVVDVRATAGRAQRRPDHWALDDAGVHVADARSGNS